MQTVSLVSRRMRRTSLLAFGALLIAAPAAYWFSRSPSAQPSVAQAIVVPAAALDFGEAVETNSFPWELPVENVTGDAIEIAGFDITCGCISLEPEKLTIPPGAKGTLKLRLDLSPKPGSPPQSHLEDFRAQISPSFTDPALPSPVWLLQGKIRRTLNLSTRVIDFGHSLLHGVPFPSKSLTVTTRDPVSDLACECSSSLAKTRVTRLSSKPDQFRVDLTPQQSLPGGPFDFSVLVRATCQDGRPAATHLRVLGQVLDEVYAEPAFVGFDPAKVGETLHQTITVRARTGKSYKVVSVRAEPAAISAQALPPAPDKSLRFRVSCPVAHAGAQRATIIFELATEPASLQKQLTVPVFLTGIGN